MKKIPTAETVLDKHLVPTNAMIEFARLHCEAQVNQIIQKVTIGYEPHCTGEEEGYTYVNRESILNAYPLENIK